MEVAQPDVAALIGPEGDPLARNPRRGDRPAECSRDRTHGIGGRNDANRVVGAAHQLESTKDPQLSLIQRDRGGTGHRHDGALLDIDAPFHAHVATGDRASLVDRTDEDLGLFDAVRYDGVGLATR
jgi:hypothetical protein